MAKTILPAGGSGGASNVKLTLTVTASDSAALSGMQIDIKDAYDGSVFKSVTYSGQPEIVTVPVGMPYVISAGDVTSYVTPANVEGIAYEDKAVVIWYKKGTRYGFKRTKAESDPAERIEYLFDAVGMDAASVTLSDGTFNPGGWATFINEVATPVMLRYDGTEAYELDRNDQTIKANTENEASDISNASFAGNAMVRFEKYKWVKRYEDSTHEYVIFCDVQFDDDYHDYAFINAGGEHMDRMYYGMFKGSNHSNTLRSLADQTIMVSQTRNTEVAYAQANGGGQAGYDTIYKSGWEFVADLLTLISKSDNSQAVFGSGRSASGNNSAIKTGTLKNKGGFWGSSNGTSDVKVFWIEGFWGNVWEGMRGCVLNGTIHVKMYPPYNFDGSGYVNTTVVPSGTSGGYINTHMLTDTTGFVPKTANGSETTYVCDGLWFNNGQVDYAIVGGSWDHAGKCGSRYLALYDLASNTAAGFGSRLSCVPLAA